MQLNLTEVDDLKNERERKKERKKSFFVFCQGQRPLVHKPQKWSCMSGLKNGGCPKKQLKLRMKLDETWNCF